MNSRKCGDKSSEKDSIYLCSVERIVNIIDKKWAILNMSIIGNNEKNRYNGITKSLNKK